MSLSAVREQFVRQSGRYDLVTANSTADFIDNGADFYIQGGQRFLEQRMAFGKEGGELSVSLATGDFETTLTGVRAVRAVAVLDDEDDTIRYLHRESFRGIREWFGDENSSLSSVERGEPIVWTLALLRDNVTSNATTEAHALKLITMPPADREYELRVEVLLGSPLLEADDDVSFWTEQQPQVLVWAALYLLEVSYRNHQGAQALLGAIQDALIGIDNDVVEQEMVEEDHVRSNFRFIRQPRQGFERHIS